MMCKAYRFYVDFNSCEAFDVVIVRMDLDINSFARGLKLSDGLRVLLYDETLECEAILRRGNENDWVAELDRGTIFDIPKERWGRLDSSG